MVTFEFHVLLIGVGDYIHSGFASLPATVRDTHALATILTDPSRCGCPPAKVHVLLTTEQATAANFRAVLSDPQ